MKTAQSTNHTGRTFGHHPHKETSTADLFEQFYGKPYEEITEADIGPDEDIDWGNDVGNEKI